jgi:tetratricopeptide (TPR) repeat protein
MIAAALLIAVLGQNYYTPQEADSLFAQANDAYYREDYGAAKEGYQKLLAHDFGGQDVLFNLGTVSLAQGDLGEAVLYLERARRVGGSSADLDAQLVMARSKQLDQVIGGSEEPLVQRVVAATSSDAVAWLFLAAWIGGFAFAGTFRFAAPSRRRWVALLAIAFFAAALPTGGLLVAHIYERETVSDGVVLAKTLIARELPKESAKVSFEVHAGLKVRLLDREGKFVRVRLPNGLEGWTESGGIAGI